MFDHQIGFTELDLEGLGEEKALHSVKDCGEEIMNMAVNISSILNRFSLLNLSKLKPQNNQH